MMAELDCKADEAYLVPLHDPLDAFYHYHRADDYFGYRPRRELAPESLSTLVLMVFQPWRTTHPRVMPLRCRPPRTRRPWLFTSRN